VNLCFAHLQFRRNLAVGKVQPHKVLFGLRMCLYLEMMQENSSRERREVTK
jgi:hypothetical protein